MAFINWALLIAVVVVVLVFLLGPAGRCLRPVRRGLHGDHDCALFHPRPSYGIQPASVLLGAVFFLTIDLLLLLSCLPKLLTGGWFALLIAAALFSSLWIWHVGVAYVTSARRDREGLPSIHQARHDGTHPRLPTTAVYLHTDADTVPLSMQRNRRTFLASFTTTPCWCQWSRRTYLMSIHWRASDLTPLGADDGIWFIELSYGFNDRVNLPDRLQLVVDKHPFLLEEASLEEATWYVSRFDIGFASHPGIAGTVG